MAFVLDIAAGILFAKVINAFSGGTFNPLIGAAGISAFPIGGPGRAEGGQLTRTSRTSR